MLEWLKSAWTKWKVRITMVGGAVVVATAYGTCSYDPQEVSEATITPVETVASPETTTVSEEVTNADNEKETTAPTTY
jgi:hypothetical protein